MEARDDGSSSDEMSKSAGDTLVLVTGASGYIASHVVRLLLQRGYRVRGTVRNLKNESKIAPIRALDIGGRLELVEADLTEEKGWDEAVAGCDYVQHLASPFPIVTDETTIPTAINGTLHVLKAVAKCHSVKKVVLTSSCVAVNEGHPQDRVFDESTWTNVDHKSVGDYPKSKTLAERAAWKLLEELKPEDNHFKLSTINPVFVVGPPLIDMQGSSISVIRQFMQNELPALPPMQLALVDVRDVALMHVEAMVRPESDGRRFLAASQPSYWFKDISRVLGKEFKQYGYKTPCFQAPGFGVWLMSFFDKQAASILDRLHHQIRFDCTAAKEVLGIEFRNPDESLIEMGYAMIERGIVKKTKGYTGVPEKYASEERIKG